MGIGGTGGGAMSDAALMKELGIDAKTMNNEENQILKELMNSNPEEEDLSDEALMR